MKTVDLPKYDQDGTLTAPVLAAIEAGATADNHATDADKIVMTFAKDADAVKFAKLVGVSVNGPADAPDAPAPDADAKDADKPAE